jgi:hypothetical protein
VFPATAGQRSQVRLLTMGLCRRPQWNGANECQEASGWSKPLPANPISSEQQMKRALKARITINRRKHMGARLATMATNMGDALRQIARPSDLYRPIRHSTKKVHNPVTHVANHAS